LVIPNSVPLNVGCAWQNKEKIIVYVGRLDKSQKRADLLPEIWSHLHPKLNDWQFHILGDGEIRASLEQKVQDLRLTNIHFHGIKDPKEFYTKAKVLCMTSAYEGFPNVLIEAQSYGVLPVAFDSYPALSEVVKDGVNALLINPYDCEAMALAIYEVVTDKARLEQLSNECLNNSGKYNTMEIGKLWLPLFN
jgi:glycosyltransferase involved in cell wall biosynthesis